MTKIKRNMNKSSCNNAIFYSAFLKVKRFKGYQATSKSTGPDFDAFMTSSLSWRHPDDKYLTTVDIRKQFTGCAAFIFILIVSNILG